MVNLNNHIPALPDRFCGLSESIQITLTEEEWTKFARIGGRFLRAFEAAEAKEAQNDRANLLEALRRAAETKTEQARGGEEQSGGAEPASGAAAEQRQSIVGLPTSIDVQGPADLRRLRAEFRRVEKGGRFSA